METLHLPEPDLLAFRAPLPGGQPHLPELLVLSSKRAYGEGPRQQKRILASTKKITAGPRTDLKTVRRWASNVRTSSHRPPGLRPPCETSNEHRHAQRVESDHD